MSTYASIHMIDLDDSEIAIESYQDRIVITQRDVRVALTLTDKQLESLVMAVGAVWRRALELELIAQEKAA